MQVKTQGIVLHTIKYGENSIIVTVFTKDFGRVSYIVNGIHRKKSVVRASFIQALSIVDIEAFHAPGKDIQRTKELRPAFIYHSIPFDPIKNAIAIFIGEILFRVLRQPEPDESMYQFLCDALEMLDRCEEGIANFHPLFLCRLTQYLGIEPNRESGDAIVFDLQNGVFLSQRPLHVHYIVNDEALAFRKLLDGNFDELSNLPFSRAMRVRLLDILIEYYRLHIPEFHGVNSLSVLHSLFD